MAGNFFVHQSEFLDLKFGGLVEEFGGGSVCDESDDLESVGVLSDNI